MVHLRLFRWAVGDGRSFNDGRSVRDAESAVMRDGEFQSENVALVLGLTERRAHLLTFAADVVIQGISVS